MNYFLVTDGQRTDGQTEWAQVGSKTRFFHILHYNERLNTKVGLRMWRHTTSRNMVWRHVTLLTPCDVMRLLCVCRFIMAKGLWGEGTIQHGSREVLQRSGIFIVYGPGRWPYLSFPDEGLPAETSRICPPPDLKKILWLWKMNRPNGQQCLAKIILVIHHTMFVMVQCKCL